MNIPNVLSVFRLILIPAFCGVYLPSDEISKSIVAAGILAVSGLTDVLDGYIARKYSMITDIGKVLDPFADKLTQLAVAICISIKHPYLSFVFAAMVICEGLMLIGGLTLYKSKIKINGAKWFGKLATVFFYLSMFFVIIYPGKNSYPIYIVTGISVALMVFSFFMYIPEYIKAKKSV